jgi:hypothetical protein
MGRHSRSNTRRDQTPSLSPGKFREQENSVSGERKPRAIRHDRIDSFHCYDPSTPWGVKGFPNSQTITPRSLLAGNSDSWPSAHWHRQSGEARPAKVGTIPLTLNVQLGSTVTTESATKDKYSSGPFT